MWSSSNNRVKLETQRPHWPLIRSSLYFVENGRLLSIAINNQKNDVIVESDRSTKGRAGFGVWARGAPSRVSETTRDESITGPLGVGVAS
jgi:hypothetical protein